MSSTEVLVIGIDAGTTNVKAAAFTLDGRTVASASRPVELHYGSHGEVEVDMNALWDSALECLSEVAGNCETAAVAAIGVTGQGDGAWLLDRQLQPLGYAATWLDARSIEVIDEWRKDGLLTDIRQRLGLSLFPGSLAAIYTARVRADAGAREAVRVHLNCKDWLRFRLTGVLATDPSDSSRTFRSPYGSSYSTESMDALGLPEMRDKLAPVLAPAQAAGNLLPDIASATGLPPGIPVATGLIDTASAGIGLGVSTPNSGYAILGTTAYVGVINEPGTPMRPHGTTLAMDLEGTTLSSLAPTGGTPSVEWARRVLGFANTERADIERHLSGVPVGSGGVTFLPYGAPNGERAPFMRPDSSASWHGLAITTTPEQMLRAAYEALAFSIAECAQELGLRDELALCGGGAASDLLCQMIADATGYPIRRDLDPLTGARGAASLAMVAAGLFPTIQTAIDAGSWQQTRVEPSDDAPRYAAAFQSYRECRTAVMPTWPLLRTIRNDTREEEDPDD